MIDTIISDLGGVLVKFDNTIATKRFSKHSKLSKEMIQEIVFGNLVDGDSLERRYDGGEMTTPKFFENVKKALKMDITFQEFDRMFSDIFVLNKDVYDLLKKFKEDYNLALLSNTNELHFNFIEKNFHIDRIFKKFILSFEVKAQKPDKKIFEAALEKLNRAPEECLYIDDVKLYVNVAKELGINALHFTDIEKLKEDMAELEIYSHSYI